MFEQPLLPGESTAVTGECTVGADHAVAGDHDADQVCTVCESDGANGFGPTDLLCELTIRERLPAGDRAQRVPYLALELRATEHDLNTIEGEEIAVEVAEDLFRDGGTYGGGVKLHLLLTVLLLQEAVQACLAILPIDEAQASVVVGSENHGSHGGGDVFDREV